MTDTRTPTRNRSGFLRIDRRAADLICRSRLGQLPGLALFDVRDRGSFERRHVEGAQHSPRRPWAMSSGAFRAAPVLIYCYHGNASQVYAGMFADFHYAEVYSVDGGFEASRPHWQQERAQGIRLRCLPTPPRHCVRSWTNSAMTGTTWIRPGSTD
jgi:rhodanese-related sulfurtransferase